MSERNHWRSLLSSPHYTVDLPDAQPDLVVQHSSLASLTGGNTKYRLTIGGYGDGKYPSPSPPILVLVNYYFMVAGAIAAVNQPIMPKG